MWIRRAESDDYQPLSDLLQQVDDLHAELLPGYFRKVPGRARRRDTIDRILRAPDETILVAVEEDGTLVGAIHVQLYDTPAIPVMVPQRRAHIDNIVVAQPARRRGYGRQLIDAASRWARDRGAAELLLTVWAGNDDAERFYQALGFRRINQVLGRPL